MANILYLQFSRHYFFREKQPTPAKQHIIFQHFICMSRTRAFIQTIIIFSISDFLFFFFLNCFGLVRIH